MDIRVAVTGATGFLGKALTRRLVAGMKGIGKLELERIKEVRALGRNKEIGESLRSEGANFVEVDLSNKKKTIEALEGCDIVIHCAAKCDLWGKYEDFLSSNVKSTENVIEACKIHKIKRLVHVSSPSIYTAFYDRFNVKEEEPIPPQTNYYSLTKLMAEKLIDDAKGEVKAVIIRPRGIFGPEDTTILPRILSRLRSGRFRIVGEGKNIVDLTYVDNVVESLILAASAGEHVIGKKYNITNGEHVSFYNFAIKKLCEAANVKFPSSHIPYNVIWYAAWTIETLYKTMGWYSEPPITLYTVAVIGNSMTLDISAAERDLKYKPKISMEEGLKRFLEWFATQPQSKL